MSRPFTAGSLLHKPERLLRAVVFQTAWKAITKEWLIKANSLFVQRIAMLTSSYCRTPQHQTSLGFCALVQYK